MQRPKTSAKDDLLKGQLPTYRIGIRQSVTPAFVDTVGKQMEVW